MVRIPAGIDFFFPTVVREQSFRLVGFCLINFRGVNFESGNDTGEKVWSDLGAEQN